MVTQTVGTEYEIVPCPSKIPKFWLVRDKHTKILVCWKKGQQERTLNNAIERMANIGKPIKFATPALAQEYINERS